MYTKDWGGGGGCKQIRLPEENLQTLFQKSVLRCDAMHAVRKLSGCGVEAVWWWQIEIWIIHIAVLQVFCVALIFSMFLIFAIAAAVPRMWMCSFGIELLVSFLKLKLLTAALVASLLDQTEVWPVQLLGPTYCGTLARDHSHERAPLFKTNACICKRCSSHILLLTEPHTNDYCSF